MEDSCLLGCDACSVVEVYERYLCHGGWHVPLECTSTRVHGVTSWKTTVPVVTVINM
jgi:hypothetical protein